MIAIDPPSKDRSEVGREYGHPWPWLVEELVEEHAVEREVDLRDLADRWDCSYKKLGAWVRRHGYRTVDYQAVERSAR